MIVERNIYDKYSVGKNTAFEAIRKLHISLPFGMNSELSRATNQEKTQTVAGKN